MSYFIQPWFRPRYQYQPTVFDSWHSFEPIPLPSEEPIHESQKLKQNNQPQKSDASKIGSSLVDGVSVLFKEILVPAAREVIVPALKEEVHDKLVEAVSNRRGWDASALFLCERGLDKMSGN
jgi:hypothetical protein